MAAKLFGLIKLPALPRELPEQAKVDRRVVPVARRLVEDQCLMTALRHFIEALLHLYDPPKQRKRETLGLLLAQCMEMLCRPSKCVLGSLQVASTLVGLPQTDCGRYDESPARWRLGRYQERPLGPTLQCVSLHRQVAGEFLCKRCCERDTFSSRSDGHDDASSHLTLLARLLFTRRGCAAEALPEQPQQLFIGIRGR
ncbi:MAG TPA: hypothetical protein VGP82_09065 [Ktedonobacterales bacterium]|nr:hypothetical protein [Ktedonobacterales bacterium]